MTISPEPAHRAIARILAGGLLPRVRVEMGMRVASRKVAEFADCDVVPSVGEDVTAYEPGVEAAAVVTGIDEGRQLVFLDIDWSSTVEF